MSDQIAGVAYNHHEPEDRHMTATVTSSKAGYSAMSRLDEETLNTLIADVIASARHGERRRCAAVALARAAALGRDATKEDGQDRGNTLTQAEEAHHIARMLGWVAP